jgi:hypothetical protein
MKDELQKIIELAEEDRGSYAIDRLAEIADLARAALEAETKLKIEIARLQSLVETKDRLFDMACKDIKKLNEQLLDKL